MSKLKKSIFCFAILLSICLSCTNPTTNESAPSGILELDSSVLIELAANDILKNLKTYKLVQSGFDNYGNYKIIFHEESTNEEMEDLIHEYYSLDKASIRLGDLNGDGKNDFAIESLWGPVLGNLYASTWHVYIQKDANWQKLAVNIQGGKGSSSESIISIENGELKTEFRAYDPDTYQIVDSVEYKIYTLNNDGLDLKSTKE